MSLFNARLNYPSFVRDEVLITPKWVKYRVGDRMYDINGDCFMTCQREHWALICEQKDAKGLPDGGESPKDLGFLKTKAAKVQLDPSNWKPASIEDHERRH